ncbi:MAG: histidine kinase [Thermoleophilia bacterium]|nr:histidine kinase [Thermoleophilia bacterium]
MPIERDMQRRVVGRSGDLYLRVFRPAAPALCALAFAGAWIVTGSDDLLRVTLGLCVSLALAGVYLLAATRVPLDVLMGPTLVLDELLIAWLVAQLPEPEALSVAFLWAVALGGLFVSLRMLAALTTLATALVVIVPLLDGGRPHHPELLIANVVIFIVIAAAMTFARRQERTTALALARSERQLAEAQRVAQIGSFLWYPQTRKLEWSDEMYRVWGAEPGEMKPSTAYLEQVVPEEREAVTAAVAAAVEHGTSYDEDLRLLEPDGSIRVVRAQGGWAQDDVGERCMVGTVQDVTELRHVEELQREFVATASHELRTPAAIVGGFAATLEHRWDELADDQRRDMVGHIRSGADRLGRLVEDVLQVSRIESRQVRLEPRAILIDEVLRVAVQEARDPRVVLADEHRGVEAWGDPERIRQVVDNLLQNALRYADQVVQVQVEPVDAHVRVTVVDDGPGVPAADRQRVFERFVRLAPPSHPSAPGTGLGLYIARQLVELGGGTMRVDDSPLGGASFSFTVPRIDGSGS